MKKLQIIFTVLLLQASIAICQTGQSKQSAARLIENTIQIEGVDAAKRKFETIKTDTLNYKITESQFNAAGYRLIDMGLFAEAVEVFKMNVALFPKSANVYDSLGEAYLFLSDKENAINNYKKIAQINSDNKSGEIIIQNIDNELSKRQRAIPGKFFDMAKLGNMNAVKAWLKRIPTLLNKKSVDGNSALHLAAYGGHVKLVDYLINRGALLDERNILGQTPYNIAVKGGSDSIKNILVQKGASQSPQKFPDLNGKYLGQKEPGLVPEIFAPGIVSTHSGVYGNITFSRDFKFASWTPNDGYRNQHYGGLIISENRNGKWSTPKEVFFMDKSFGHRSPFFSLNSDKIYFQTYERNNERSMDQHEKFYFSKMTPEGWSKPELLDTVFDDFAVHWQFSLDKKENLYFGGSIRGVEKSGGIYFSEFKQGKYSKPVKIISSFPANGIPAPVIAPAVSPSGDYIVFIRFITLPNTTPRFVLFVSFKDSSGVWSDGVELSDKFGITGANNPRVTPDGRFIFYVGVGDSPSSWVDARVIEKLRLKK